MKNFLNILTGRKKEPGVEPQIRDGNRIYAIGDIHGRPDLLEQIQKLILHDSKGYQGQKHLVYLGDYIDRGNHSFEVLDRLINKPLPSFNIVHLRGNHEQSMLDFLQNPEIGRAWFTYGGLATLVSYKVKVTKIPTTNEDYKAIQSQLKECVPSSHIAFLENTELFHTSGSYYFVHAGIKPNCSLKYQQAEDQLWIRESFISHVQAHEKIIVHGHTITAEPDFHENRIGIDTGAYITNKLSCLVLEKKSQRILQTEKNKA